LRNRIVLLPGCGVGFRSHAILKLFPLK
jgi:hypothetical protein